VRFCVLPPQPCSSLYDFHVLSPLRQVLKVYRVGLEEDIKAAVVQWCQQQPRMWGGNLLASLSAGCLPQYPCGLCQYPLLVH
jgi:hypothetical protein